MSEVNTDLKHLNATKTVLEIDLAAYSDVARVLEENLNVEAVKSFQDQIQQFVNYGLAAVGLNRDDVVLATAGDNAILIFDTAVTMHKFAQAVHQETSRHNASKSIPMAKRWFRMGAATGIMMVIPTERRIVGVTIARAVRLEAAARQGQLLIDRETYQRLPKEIQNSYGPEEMIPGKRTERFRGHRCILTNVPDEAGRDILRGVLRNKIPVFPAYRRGLTVSAIAVSVAGLVRAITAWWIWPTIRPFPTAPPEAATASIVQPVVAPRLSIVVLPFANLSNDPDQQYFADGITEDLTTDLSRIPGMFVISRNTAFTYRNKRVDTRQIGRELGVRYLLEGSVQRSGNQVRVTAQLIDAETDAHLWAERFDRDTGDFFVLQNEITSRTANTLNLELITVEAARATDHPDALDYILRGRAALLKPESRDSYAESISLFEHALSIDPQSVEAQTRLAGSLASLVLTGLTTSVPVDLQRADEMIGRALAVSPRFALAHHVKGQVLRAQNRCEEAIPEYETALASNPNLVGALNGLGWCTLYAGSIDEVIPLVGQALRRSPRDPGIAYWYQLIGTVHLLQSRTEEAIGWLEKARSAGPANPLHHGLLAAAYALSDNLNRAAAELAEARRLRGKGSFSSIAKIKAVWGSLLPTPSPKTRALFEATYLAGLRKAGVPEE